ncbi:beta-ketoacyl synthase chain length factor [Taibaiella koreensis]|uniref:beta-ketoacyl synthase chain length factor n=1 Tax=Taibaiella koreensis TaxID=1268548 RepID=UPI0013C35443|nr:beta-ketoacyl synthase chain length factor [Taibaiella koreensis]
MKPIYITHTSAITPQHQAEGRLLDPLVADTDGKLQVIEPDYTAVIPAMQLRRMSRVLRMGVYTGMDCLRRSGCECPDGIITGTGKGSMTDTEKFVKELAQYQEGSLNPTPFILSTYNAVNGAIALQTRATGYNQTYVHRGSSFETALYDAQLKLNTVAATQHYLVGCFDEITPEYFLVKSKVGYWKKERDPGQSLWQQADSPGTLAGEGAAFFMLSNSHDGAITGIHALQTTYKTPVAAIGQVATELIVRNGWQPGDIDMLVLGFNGDSRDEPYYEALQQSIPGTPPVLAFKHLCGEYETSGGFALWLLCQLLNGKSLPGAVWYRAPDKERFHPRKILYYNHYRGQNHNLILLSA